MCTFRETRKISVKKAPGTYVWTWQTTLIAARDVRLIANLWPNVAYYGLGLRLAPDVFQDGRISPSGTTSGCTPTHVSFRGNGAEVTFEQDAKQANALFVSNQPDFAFMSLGPTNLRPLDLKQEERLACEYVIRVGDI